MYIELTARYTFYSRVSRFGIAVSKGEKLRDWTKYNGANSKINTKIMLKW